MHLKNLAQVAPAPQEGPQITTLDNDVDYDNVSITSRCWRTLNACRHFSKSYDKLQISHRGMYSVERLQAFQCYCEKTSVARAVIVCLLTPLPPLLVTVLLECIPLSSPDLGWKANYMFWIRFYISGVIVNMGLSYQVKDLVNDLELSVTQCLSVGMVSIATYVLTTMTIASVWAFPVPFGIILGVGPCFAIYLCVLYIIIGRKKFEQNPNLGRELKLQLYVMGVQAVLITIYPAFNGLYINATSGNRAALVLLLPVTKLVMKNVVAWTCSHLEEYVPVIAVFSVEVFNALYVATCMQTANSGLATILIIGLDVIHAILTFHDLQVHSRSIQREQLALLKESTSKNHASGDLVTTILTTCQQLRMFRTKGGKLIRVRSPLKHSVGAIKASHCRVLDKLAAHQRTFASLEVRDASVGRLTSKTLSSSSANVLSSLGSSGRPHSPQDGSSCQTLLRETQQVDIVENTLQLLFRCEYLALVEYVECAVPILYGVYLTVLCQLPTREYFSNTRDITPDQLKATMTNLCVYVALEVVSFVVMHAVLKRKFGLSSLHLLAFVLETQMIQLQSRLFVWIVFILQFTLQHYGVDFTFRFEWVH